MPRRAALAAAQAAAGGPEAPPPGPEASAAHLLGRLHALEWRVRLAVDSRRRSDPAPDDPFRGLYLSDEHVQAILGPGGDCATVASPEAAAELAAAEEAADRAEAAGGVVRLRDLARRFGLDELEVELLLVALAPDLDSRFEQLYGYLNDDVTRRRASVGLALALCGVPATSVRARLALGPLSPLLRCGLVVVEDQERPLLTRALRVPDRVSGWCLGDPRPDPAVAALLAGAGEEQDSGRPAGTAEALGRVLAGGARLAYVREATGTSGREMALAALAASGHRGLVVDLTRLEPDQDLAVMGRLLGREARLAGAGLVAGPVEALAERGSQGVRALAEQEVAVVLLGRATWDPAWSAEVPVVVEAPVPGREERERYWRAFLGAGGPGVGAWGEEETGHLRLRPEQIARASRAARWQAELEGAELGARHLQVGARSQNAAGLERLARRIRPEVGWDDLVLAPAVEGHLRELAARARQRDRVLDEWGMRPGGGRGRGIAALFAGESGTGKTMSAEVLAGDLGLDLYAVNLATVVDKYVGETEKNLERIFSEADGVDAVLLFDEADALFGRRSEVRDANDRYANIEVAYLLQRMETFDGLALLSTNLRANVDEAFSRRLDALVEFPMPDAGQRLLLWEHGLPPAVPRAGDLDLGFCAGAFELSGGHIRNITLGAAYLAADAGRAVTMGDIIRSVQREYRKLGHLCTESEFGPYHGLLAG